MKLSKKEFIEMFNKTPFDPIDAIFLVGHGIKTDNNGGVLGCLWGNSKDVIYALCKAYQESPELYKVVIASIEAFGEIMIDTIKSGSKEEGEKITPMAKA